jgi:hypothetical protein
MFKWLRFILTDEQNQWDWGILVWAAGCIEFLSTSAYVVWVRGNPWDAQAFGTGLLGVLGAGAALQWIRQKGTEKVTVTQTVTPGPPPATITSLEQTTNAVKPPEDK